MDVNIKRLRHKHGKHDRKKHEAEQAARLAPLEEIHASQQPSGNGGGGDGTYQDTVIKVDRNSVKVAGDLSGEQREGANIFKMEPIVVALLIISLAFIAFIAWQITLMEKPG